MRPLVLLDVDGVLNAVGRARRPGPESWPSWRTGTAVADGRSWPIRWAPEMVEAVRRWTALADVRWLTTWGHDANASLRYLLDLPHLPVAGTHDEPAADSGDERTPASASPAGASSAGAALAGAAGADAEAHAAVTPAAADPLTGRWWKFDVARRLVERDPARRVVWLDDDLALEERSCSWIRAHAECLLLAPEPRAGLTPAHVRSVDAFLGRRALST